LPRSLGGAGRRKEHPRPCRTTNHGRHRPRSRGLERSVPDVFYADGDWVSAIGPRSCSRHGPESPPLADCLGTGDVQRVRRVGQGAKAPGKMQRRRLRKERLPGREGIQRAEQLREARNACESRYQYVDGSNSHASESEKSAIFHVGQGPGVRELLICRPPHSLCGGLSLCQIVNNRRSAQRGR